MKGEDAAPATDEQSQQQTNEAQTGLTGSTQSSIKRSHTRTVRETKSTGATEAVDPFALSKALEEATGHREGTPSASPSRKRQRIYGDRFVPNRQGQDFQASFSLLHADGSPSSPSRTKRRPANSELHFQRSEYTLAVTHKHDRILIISSRRGQQAILASIAQRTF